MRKGPIAGLRNLVRQEAHFEFEENLVNLFTNWGSLGERPVLQNGCHSGAEPTGL